MENFIDLIYFGILIGVGYFVGNMVEKRHYRSICRRESELLCVPVVTGKSLSDPALAVEKAELVQASIVISTDYFKTILAGLRNILGGEVSAYETMLDRGRREAILRLKQKARCADIMLNLRIETSQVSRTGTVEIFAYATAVYYKK